ncbi:MAG: hypothetical protein CBC60_06565 [Betaproteobacteria bacterium TMED100]|nr:MAG: hypothetical protein CBC60_06565 [Betaproteobacteria bacterium TMED100]
MYKIPRKFQNRRLTCASLKIISCFRLQLFKKLAYKITMQPKSCLFNYSKPFAIKNSETYRVLRIYSGL